MLNAVPVPSPESFPGAMNSRACNIALKLQNVIQYYCSAPNLDECPRGILRCLSTMDAQLRLYEEARKGGLGPSLMHGSYLQTKR
jgi:hypothetical protein